ncbi:protein IQ-DOMAIN 3-like [Bidens hawaiensis]|uniref:protein IQ-DOMAIN 3-like n=1 Tax=Bidens hawaiensis TaxID=980011 RepID=UPI004048EB5A
MGKKGGWFSAVRKAFYTANDSKDNINNINKEKKLQKSTSSKSWFGKQTNETESSEVPDTPAVGSPQPDLEDDPAEQQGETSEPVELENETSNETIPEREPSRPTKAEDDPQIRPAKQPEIELKKPSRVAAAFRRILGKSKEELAAIKVQTAFRRFLARRKLKALKGLVRLRVLVQSQSVKRQAITTLRCMQTLARVQSQVRTRRIRMAEENQALQRQLMQKRERDLGHMKPYLGNKWDNSRRSKEQIVATMQHKESAAARRERALAYAQTQQQMWKNPSKSANPTFMDPNNPQWGWSWLDRWMAARPWESPSQTEGPVESEPSSPTKLIRSSSDGDVSIKLDGSPSVSSPRSPSLTNRRLTLSSPKGKNDFAPSPLNRRHSIANSSFRETKARVSSTRVSSPRSTKTKSVIPTLSQGKSTNRSPSPSPLGSVKKGTMEKKTTSAPSTRRMSLSGTPSTSSSGCAGNRRLSISSRGGGGGGGGGGNRRLSISSSSKGSTR